MSATKMEAKFDIKKFHEKLFEFGVLPLTLFRKVNRYLDFNF